MKFATSLSSKGIELFIRENNEVCEEKYAMTAMPRALEEEIVTKLDVIEDHPRFSYEIPAYQTKRGAPYVIDFDGAEFFNWAESED